MNQKSFAQKAKTGSYKLMLLLILITCSFGVFSQEKKYENEKFVIVLDVQQYWTDKALSKKAADGMLTAINALIEKSNPEKVIYVTSIHKVLSISFKGFKVDTTLNNEFDRNLKIINDNIFVKYEGDAFATKALTDFLDKNKAKEIIVTGLLAEKCVNATTLGGLSKGYDIYLIPEAVGGKSDKSKAKVFEKLKEAGVKVLSLNDLKN